MKVFDKPNPEYLSDLYKGLKNLDLDRMREVAADWMIKEIGLDSFRVRLCRMSQNKDVHTENYPFGLGSEGRTVFTFALGMQVNIDGCRPVDLSTRFFPLVVEASRLIGTDIEDINPDVSYSFGPGVPVLFGPDVVHAAPHIGVGQVRLFVDAVVDPSLNLPTSTSYREVPTLALSTGYFEDKLDLIYEGLRIN